MATSTEDRIAALEAMVADLRAELAKPRRRDSMSQTFTCPACGGGHILGVREIKEFTHGGLVAFALGNRPSYWKGGEIGDPLQAYVCTACRFVEWHVASLDQLTPDGKNILEFHRPEEAPPDGGPYR